MRRRPADPEVVHLPFRDQKREACPAGLADVSSGCRGSGTTSVTVRQENSYRFHAKAAILSTPASVGIAPVSGSAAPARDPNPARIPAGTS